MTPIDWLIGAVLVLWVLLAFIVPVVGAFAHVLLVVAVVLVLFRSAPPRPDA